MKNILRLFIFTGLICNVQLLSYADGMTVTLPNGTKQKIEVRKIYSSTNPTDNLIDAIAAKDFSMVKEFIEKGANINSFGSSGQVPLSEALSPDEAEILDFLLNHGADVNLNSKGALGEMSVLEIAVANGYLSSTRKLLEHGAQIEKENSILNETVLFNAIRSGNVELIKLLIANRADITHKNFVGETPVSLAERSENASILEILKPKN